MGFRKLTTEEFIRRANIVHGFRYDYSLSNYLAYDLKVEILCSKHGSFWQRPHDHLEGKGCPKCGKSRSKAEIRLSEYIESLGFYVVNSDREILDGKEVDIYIPSASIGIEFNGLRYHSSLFRSDPYFHRNKYVNCKEKGIRLIQFYEDEWFKNRLDVFKKTSDALFGRDIGSFKEDDILNVNLDYGIGVDLSNLGYELVEDTGPIPYLVKDNFKTKEKLTVDINSIDLTKDPVIWLSGMQKFKKTK